MDRYAYAYGLWLGNGFCSFNLEYPKINDYYRVGYTSKSREECEIVAQELGFSMSPRRSEHKGRKPLYEVYNRAGDGYIDMPRVHAEDKELPEWIYDSSYDTKISLIQGLMDTDGMMSGGNSEWVFKSEKLVDGMAKLFDSLGWSYHRTTKKVKQYPDNIYYRITLRHGSGEELTKYGRHRIDYWNDRADKRAQEWKSWSARRKGDRY